MCIYQLLVYTCSCRAYFVYRACTRAKIYPVGDNPQTYGHCKVNPCPYTPCLSQRTTGICYDDCWCTAPEQEIESECGFHEEETEERNAVALSRDETEEWTSWKRDKLLDVHDETMRRRKVMSGDVTTRGWGSGDDVFEKGSGETNTDPDETESEGKEDEWMTLLELKGMADEKKLVETSSGFPMPSTHWLPTPITFGQLGLDDIVEGSAGEGSKE